MRNYELQPEMHAELALGKKHTLSMRAPFRAKEWIEAYHLYHYWWGSVMLRLKKSGQRSYHRRAIKEENQGPSESIVLDIPSCFITLIACFP